MFLTSPADATLPDHTAAEADDQCLHDLEVVLATPLPLIAAGYPRQNGLTRGRPETSIMVLSDILSIIE